MSLVIAIKDKDRVVFGSDKQSSVMGSKDHTSTKIWELSDLPGAIMGSVGHSRASQIIQYSGIIDKNEIGSDIDTEFIVRSLAPTLATALKANGMKLEDEDSRCLMMPNDFLFAYGDKAWMIWRDLSVSEIDNYLVIGSGSEVARGVLFATEDKNPFERIVTCIDAAAESTLYVDDGVDILATSYRELDKKLIAKVLGFEIEEPKQTEEVKPSEEKPKKKAKKTEKNSENK